MLEEAQQAPVIENNFLIPLSTPMGSSVSCNNMPALPSGLPRNWPRSSEQDLRDFPIRRININSDQAFHFASNVVKTSKYEIYNFLPKFLLEEFNPRTKIANCYFLLISALQCIPAISNTLGYPTTMLPLTFVVVVNAVFQIFEDLSRHRADNEANSSTVLRLNPLNGNFEEIRWSDLRVGDYVKVASREQIPADLVILGVNEKPGLPPQGLCYVETKSLDGETNLKIRHAMPNTLDQVKDGSSVLQLRGCIEMEHPNKLIDSFSGVLEVGFSDSRTASSRESIQAKNVLLRGCVLRNTDWIIGLVLNTGPDTKIMMSSTETRPKSSSLEARSSSQIGLIIGLLAIVCLAASTGQLIWNYVYDIDSFAYLRWSENPGLNWLLKFFYSFLLHASFIPVSLYVSMSVVRYYQSTFMNQDIDMYFSSTDSPALVRTMTLNEELGQISHVFSDKTGTLTCNVMDFRKMSIGGVCYGLGITEIGKAAWKLLGKSIPPDVLEGEELARKSSVPHVSFYDPKFVGDVKAGGEQREKIEDFFRILSICHDVIPERIEGGIRLSASNPDDEALVCAAAYFGFQFSDRRGNNVVIQKGAEEQFLGRAFRESESSEETIEVLEIIAFTSKRKRMSVIIREKDGKIRLLMKGADTAMFSRIKGSKSAVPLSVRYNATDISRATAANSSDLSLDNFDEKAVAERKYRRQKSECFMKTTEEHMVQFAQEGLRCLVVAATELNLENYLSWSQKYRNAKSDMVQIEAKKLGEENEIERLEDIIEQKLELIGVTAIEDRLQDGVPDCIASLAAAGIKIWVLTGDKEETAINIAVACNLVLPKEYMRQIIINKESAADKDAMKALLETEIKLCETESEPRLPKALVVDGPSLISVMADGGPSGLRDLFLRMSQNCAAVVGCRVSPDQKREMVRLIKRGVPGVRTLAVGDGANDVAMIQEAHVGVGIKGEEGLQAVNSSDFAVAQFKYLTPLLLKHGRYNYIRMSNLVCYIFYKNILFSFCHFWYNFLNAFSGQKYFTEGGIQMFNLFFTSIPILFYGVYDRDVDEVFPTTLFPQLYSRCIANNYFNSRVFWSWISCATYESVILTILPLIFLHNSSWNDSAGSHWAAGTLCLTAIVIICNLKIFVMQTQWFVVHAVVLLLSVASWFMVAAFISSYIILDFDYFHVWHRVMGSGTFWMSLLFLVVAVTSKDLFLASARREIMFSPDQIVQEMVDGASASEKRKTIDLQKVSPGASPAFSGEFVGDSSTQMPVSSSQKRRDDGSSPMMLYEQVLDSETSPSSAKVGGGSSSDIRQEDSLSNQDKPDVESAGANLASSNSVGSFGRGRPQPSSICTFSDSEGRVSKEFREEKRLASPLVQSSTPLPDP